MDDTSYWQAPSEPWLQLTPHRVIQFKLVKLLSPIGRLAFATFVLYMDAGSSNFTVDGFDEVVIGHSCLDKTAKLLEHIIGIQMILEFR